MQKWGVHRDRGNVIDEIGGVVYGIGAVVFLMYFEMYVLCSCFTNFDTLFTVYIL